MKKIKLVKKNVKETKVKKEKPKKEKKKFKFNFKVNFWIILLSLGIIFVTGILVFALYIIITAPEFNRDKLYQKEPTIIYYADGTEMSRYGSSNRIIVTYDELPQVLVDAIVATEDSRFFQHTGLDIARFSKALIGQLFGNDSAGGASTLSMQVIKNDYTNRTSKGIKGIIRKFTDIYMSIFKLESNYTKEEIMEFYVNTMWFASDNNIYIEKGIFGVEQASQYFFGKSVSELSLAEASVIAGMFQNARTLNPYNNIEGITDRQNTVLKLMVQHGYISEQEKEDVQKIPISSLLVKHDDDNGSLNTQQSSALVDYIVKQVKQELNINPYNNPMKIYTTIDKKVQDVLTKLENGDLYPFPNDVIQEGVAVTSTENGSIVGLSGGRNIEGTRTDFATGVKKQPGSAAKIFMDYGPYLEAFPEASPSTLFLDEKTTYSNGQAISDADDQHLGLISMRTALARSRNIPALLAFQAVVKEKGDQYIADFVHSLGIDFGNTLFESASIGGFDGTNPLEMSAAYGAFARGGYYIEPYVFTKIEMTTTGDIYEHKYEKVQVMSEETAYMINSILMYAQTNNHTGGSFSISGTDVASKTGTPTLDSTVKDKYKIPQTATIDAWDMSYSPEYVIGLWVGYEKVTSEYYMNATLGGKYRTGIMSLIAPKIFSKNKRFTKPAGVTEVTIEKETFPAQLPSAYTPNDMKVTDLFKVGAEPTEVSSRYDKLANPTNGSYHFNGTTLSLSWSPIATPSAIDPDYLTEHFNTYYPGHANEYYNRRIQYNNNVIGTLGYQIYIKDASGNLNYIGRTEASNYIVNNPANGTNTYVIKSAYSKFSSNMSDGLNIMVTTNIDSNVDDMIGGNQNTDPTTDNNNNNNNSTTKPNTDTNQNHNTGGSTDLE